MCVGRVGGETNTATYRSVRFVLLFRATADDLIFFEKQIRIVFRFFFFILLFFFCFLFARRGVGGEAHADRPPVPFSIASSIGPIGTSECVEGQGNRRRDHRGSSCSPV